MRIKFVVVAFMLVLYMLLLPACQTEGTPASGIEGGQSISGGQDLGSDVNLKDISVAGNGKITVITMSFIKGSRKSTVSETKLNAVPKYSASILSLPQRLRVDLDVDYWDYQKSDGWFRDSQVCGSFKTINSGDNSISLYFQLTGDISASFEEESDRLKITLKPLQGNTDTAYFVGLNAYEEYEQNLIPADLGFSPTLCAGGSDIMLISSPFSSRQKADEFADKAAAEISGVAATKKPYAFELKPGSLPQYNSTIDLEEVNQKLILQVDGKGQTLPVLVENGRYLCTSPDGSILYARSYFPGAGGDTPATQKERLWIIGRDDKKTELDLPNFSLVEQAAFSQDGKYLAILDTSMHSKVLYVYSMETGELKNLGEEGFGDFTSSFVWDMGKDTVYAMTGHNTMRLMKYNFDEPEGSRISPVETAIGNESKIATDGKSLFFADQDALNPGGSTGQTGQIYAVDILTGTRSMIAPGASFKLSPDGNYLATLAPSVAGGQELMDLNIVNLSSGEAIPVASGISVDDYEFGVDSDNLFFTTSTYQGITGIYHNAFLKYSVAKGTSDLIGYSTAESIRRGQKHNEMYLIDFFDAPQDYFYVTYIYTFK